MPALLSSNVRPGSGDRHPPPHLAANSASTTHQPNTSMARSVRRIRRNRANAPIVKALASSTKARVYHYDFLYLSLNAKLYLYFRCVVILSCTHMGQICCLLQVQSGKLPLDEPRQLAHNPSTCQPCLHGSTDIKFSLFRIYNELISVILLFIIYIFPSFIDYAFLCNDCRPTKMDENSPLDLSTYRIYHSCRRML